MSALKFFEYGETKNPKYLVIFLHGYGSNGHNLLELSHEFKDILPEAHFISPNAVEPWEGGFPDSYQWFSLYSDAERKPLTSISDNIKNSSKILQNFIDVQLQRFNLAPKDLLLAGFSQGAMMSLYQGLTMVEKPKGIISFSGRLVLPEMIGEKTIQKPEICLIHGRRDAVLPFENFIEAEKLLEQEKIPFESHAFDNLDHTIDIGGIKAARRFVRRILT